MNDTNYIGGVIKILETPKQKIVKTNNIVVTKFRAQIPQLRNSRLVTLAFWGNLARDVLTYYKVNDYLIIEGYLSLRNKTTLPEKNQKPKKVEITVLKAYPFLLNYDRSIRKI
jgi:single-stranded DNA-binding protein